MSLVASVRRRRREVGRLLLRCYLAGAAALGTLTLLVALPIATGPALLAALLVTAGGGAALWIRSLWQGRRAAAQAEAAVWEIERWLRDRRSR